MNERGEMGKGEGSEMRKCDRKVKKQDDGEIE